MHLPILMMLGRMLIWLVAGLVCLGVLALTFYLYSLMLVNLGGVSAAVILAVSYVLIIAIGLKYGKKYEQVFFRVSQAWSGSAFSLSHLRLRTPGVSPGVKASSRRLGRLGRPVL